MSMTLGRWRKLTRDLPDDTPILVLGPDHSLEESRADIVTAVFDDEGYIEEEWSGSTGKVITSLVVS